MWNTKKYKIIVILKYKKCIVCYYPGEFWRMHHIILYLVNTAENKLIKK